MGPFGLLAGQPFAPLPEEKRTTASTGSGISAIAEAILSKIQHLVVDTHYCSCEGKTFTLGQMAELVATAFEQHYERTSDEPTGLEGEMMNDKESQYEWYRHGDPLSEVIQEAAGIDSGSAQHPPNPPRHVCQRSNGRY